MTTTITQYFDQIASIKIDEPIPPLNNNHQIVDFSAVTMSNFQGSITPILTSGISNLTFKEDDRRVDSLKGFSKGFQSKQTPSDYGNQNPLEPIGTIINRIEDKCKLQTNKKHSLSDIPSVSEDSRQQTNSELRLSIDHSKDQFYLSASIAHSK